MNEVEVFYTEDNFEEFYTQKIESINSILLRQSSENIKSYYGGGLATLSYRGTNAQQSNIIWKGFNINSPFLGLYDLNMLPNFDDIEYLKTNDFAIGKNYEFKESTLSPNYANFSLEFGSFGMINQAIALGINELVYQQFKFAHRKSDNNYSFTENDKIKRLENAAYDFTDVQYTLSTKLKTFQYNFWFQDYEKEVPFATPNAYQKDINIRNVITWNLPLVNQEMTVSLGHFRETIEYNGDYSWLNSFLSKVDYKTFFWNKKSIIDMFKLGLAYRINQAFTPYYQKNRWQYIGNINLTFRKNISLKNVLKLKLKEQINSTNFYLPEWSFSYRRRIGRGNRLSFNNSFIELIHAHNIRIPTLNDMFWQPLGNPNLKEESGFTNTFNFSYDFNSEKNSKSSLVVSAALFHKEINNFIQWRPRFGGNWQPENVKSVRIMGFEPKLKLSLSKNHWNLIALASTTYTNSKNTSSFINNDASVGKQLIYVPYWKGNFNAQISFKNARLNIFYLKQSRQFTNTSNTQQTNQFSSTNLSFEQRVTIDDSTLNLIFSINNLFNKNYFLYANRPSPLRNYSITLKLNFNEKKNY